MIHNQLNGSKGFVHPYALDGLSGHFALEKGASHIGPPLKYIGNDPEAECTHAEPE